MSAKSWRQKLVSLLSNLYSNWAMALIVVIFVVLGVRYSNATPMFETPAEPWHYRYVRHLADNRSLPPLAALGDEWEQGESHQPPLYYALGALLISPISVDKSAPLYERNIYASLGVLDSPNNKNAVLHVQGENRPYRGVVLAVHLLRLFSLLCSVGTVLATYGVARQIAPRSRLTAACAAGLVAFNPQFLFVSASVSNDPLAILLVTTALYMSLTVCNDNAFPYRTPILLGITVGLATLTHWSGLVAGVLIPSAYALRFLSSGSRRFWADLVRPVLIASAGVMLIGGWWYMRNLLLYHDLLGVEAMLASRSHSLSLVNTLQALVAAVKSYWGVFGWMNVPTDEVFYILMQVLSVLGVIGLILQGARIYWGQRGLRYQRWQSLGLLVLWLLIIFITFIRRVQLTGESEGRQLYPAIAAIAFFMFAGVTAWAPRRYGAILMVLVLAILVSVSALAPTRYILPAYAQPTRLTIEQAPATMNDVYIGFGDDLFLLGYEMDQDSVQAGHDLRLRLYWLARKHMTRDYAIYVHVFGRQGERIGGVDTHPGGGNLPTRLWLPGDMIRDEYVVHIAPEATAPTAGAIRVGVYEAQGRKELPITDAYGRTLGPSPQIASVRIAPVRPFHYQPQQAAQVNLGAKVTFAGFDLVSGAISADNSLTIALYWQALSRMGKD